MKAFRYVSSFLAGLTVGAGIALLVTPMSRKKMQRKVADIGERVVDKVDDLKVAARRMAS
ncbi:MAG TPA: YtxH domain-containing protein [Thermoanaerobaculia bacterium]|nr:YtxH domain-containing protein [Thermoanaerobaculia bacterium]